MQKMHWNMSSGKWQPFSPEGDELIWCWTRVDLMVVALTHLLQQWSIMLMFTGTPAQVVIFTPSTSTAYPASTNCTWGTPTWQLSGNHGTKVTIISICENLYCTELSPYDVNGSFHILWQLLFIQSAPVPIYMQLNLILWDWIGWC